MHEGETVPHPATQIYSRLPPLPCGHCGTVEVPQLGPGTTTHAARAICAHCGRFLKWLPKALITGKAPMAGSVNHCVLLGSVGRHGVEVRYAGSGTPIASFALVCTEVWQDGKAHDVYIPCEVVGKRAEQAGELEPGALILFEGKLARRKRGEQWELVVSGFDMTVLALTATMTGSSN